MIGCFAKSDRAFPLFSELSKLNPIFVNLGVIKPTKGARLLGSIASGPGRVDRLKNQSGFSPFFRNSMERQAEKLLASHTVDSILYWGAVNSPLPRNHPATPYFIITDGPFDPGDPTYPPEWNPGRWSGEYFRRQSRIYNEATHTFTLSDWARQKILSLHSVPASRITKMGWGPIHTSSRPTLSVTGNYFLSLGNEWTRKGMDFVAEAGRLVNQHTPNCQTILAGNPVGARIPNRTGVIQFPHTVPPQIAQLMIANARALIVASRFDASPHIIYEALQAGTPVIGSRICGIPEALGDPRSGLIVEPQNVDGLVRAMLQILQEDEPRQRQNAYDAYLASGGWRTCAEHIQDIVLKY